MTSKPMLFSSAMVRALLAGTKTQTRRPVKWPTWLDDHEFAGAAFNVSSRSVIEHNSGKRFVCPHPVGSQIWVRETWAVSADLDRYAPSKLPCGCLTMVAYLASDPDTIGRGRVRQSIHMPRWASRITLEVTGVRVELLQDISEADALAEGVRHWGETWIGVPVPDDCACKAYSELWDSINGKNAPWDNNPWVWCYTFRRVTP